MPKWLSAFRKVLGKIADFFIAGRNLGAFDRRPGPQGGFQISTDGGKTWQDERPMPRHDNEEVGVKPDAPQPQDYRRH